MKRKPKTPESGIQTPAPEPAPAAGWTPEDQREFDRLVTLMDSIRQMDRIEGRIQWRNFKARFTKAQLDEMWEGIKDK